MIKIDDLRAHTRAQSFQLPGNANPSSQRPRFGVPASSIFTIYFIPVSMLATLKSALTLTVTLLPSVFVMCAS